MLSLLTVHCRIHFLDIQISSSVVSLFFVEWKQSLFFHKQKWRNTSIIAYQYFAYLNLICAAFCVPIKEILIFYSFNQKMFIHFVILLFILFQQIFCRFSISKYAFWQQPTVLQNCLSFNILCNIVLWIIKLGVIVTARKWKTSLRYCLFFLVELSKLSVCLTVVTKILGQGISVVLLYLPLYMFWFHPYNQEF